MERQLRQNISNSKGSQDQTAVIRFLDGGAGGGLPVRRIDTHGAMIFLTGGRALKIKRAVKYDYMDLSTVDRRHAQLDRELELNKTAAPTIYEAVVPIVRRPDGALALGGPGTALEWALSMRRFPAEAELINIARDRGIDDLLALNLGTSIARYHAAAPVRGLNGAVLIEEIIDELSRVFAALGGTLYDDADAVIGQCRRVLAEQADRLRERSKNGHIRRCHGDLHLRNIVMIDGAPTPFDALEFDERLGTCDTLYDLAFLLMDLDHLGLSHASNLVLNAYLSDGPEDLSDAGLALLPLYLAVRAAIRAMVDAQTAAVSGDGAEIMRDARAYLVQARAYLDPAPPVLVTIGGYSGTGKTTIARAIAHQTGAAPGAIHIRSDVERKRMLHCDPFDALGPRGYTQRITDLTYASIRAQAVQILAQGHSVILDAVHGDAAVRQAAEDVAIAAGARFVGIWLTSPTPIRAARVGSRGPDASDADADVVARQANVDPGVLHWVRIDTDRPFPFVVGAVSAAVRPREPAEVTNHGETNVG